jgi:hypothetical protein
MSDFGIKINIAVNGVVKSLKDRSGCQLSRHGDNIAHRKVFFKAFLAELTSWGSLIFIIGLAIFVWSILLHNALSGELFWGLRYAPLTAERVWTYRAALTGFALLFIGLIFDTVSPYVQKASLQLHTGQ